MPIALPCIILVRDGTKRLPRKWALPWGKGSLLRHATGQAAACEHVSKVIVASDSQEILDHAGANHSVLRPPVGNKQTSLDGLRWVQEQCGLSASYVLLVQCTSPFVNAEDLTRLVLCSGLPSSKVSFLGRKGKPSGMGYIFPPFIGDVRGQCVEQDAPDIDIDSRADYERALEIAK